MQLLRTAALCLLVGSAFAQPLLADFSPDARPLSEQDLRAALVGKTFSLIRPEGGHMTLYFEDSGYVQLGGFPERPQDRFRGNGKWHVEGSLVCFKWITALFADGCLEARQGTDRLILRRPDGVIVQWVPN